MDSSSIYSSYDDNENDEQEGLNMAAFIERLRKEKMFRLKVIAIAVIVVLIYNNMGEEKKEAGVFNQESKCNAIKGVGSAQTCPSVLNEEGDYCTVAYKLGTIFGISGDDDCVNCVPTGLYALSASNCCSGAVNANIKGTDDQGDVYLCKEATTTETCNSKEKGIADMLSNMAPTLSCKTAYYATIAGGAIIFFMIFSVI